MTINFIRVLGQGAPPLAPEKLHGGVVGGAAQGSCNYLSTFHLLCWTWLHLCSGATPQICLLDFATLELALLTINFTMLNGAALEPKVEHLTQKPYNLYIMEPMSKKWSTLSKTLMWIPIDRSRFQSWKPKIPILLVMDSYQENYKIYKCVMVFYFRVATSIHCDHQPARPAGQSAEPACVGLQAQPSHRHPCRCLQPHLPDHTLPEVQQNPGARGRAGQPH